MGREGMHVGVWWASQKERDQQEELDVDGRYVTEILWIGLISLRIGNNGGLL
jgi:hypothetical protein